MISLSAAFISSVLAAALALWLARALGVDSAIMALRRDRDHSIHTFITECVDASRFGGAPPHSRIIRRALAIAGESPSLAAAKNALEQDLAARLTRGMPRGNASLTASLPLIAVGGLVLALAGLLTGGLQPARFGPLSGLAFVLMLLGSGVIVSRNWAFAMKPRAASARVLRHALAIETALCVKAGLPPAVVAARLRSMVPASGPIRLEQPAQPAQAA